MFSWVYILKLHIELYVCGLVLLINLGALKFFGRKVMFVREEGWCLKNERTELGVKSEIINLL